MRKILLCLIVAAATACGIDSTTQPSEAILAVASAGDIASAGTTTVCHVTGSGNVARISVGSEAVGVHLAHGDVLAGEGECPPASDLVLDQVSEGPLGDNFSCGRDVEGSLYQTFTPGLPNIARVDIDLNRGVSFPKSGMIAEVTIREAVGGPILAESNTRVPGQWTGGDVSFSFDPPITVVPGATYVLGWNCYPGGHVWLWRGSTSNPYPGGRYLAGGTSSTLGWDVYFKTWGID